MNGKTVSILAVCAAVVSAAVSGVIVVNGRRDIANAKAAEAKSAEKKAALEEKKARQERETAAAEAAKEKAAAEKAKEERAAEESAGKRREKELEAEKENLAAKKQIADQEAAAARSRADEAAAARETARLEAEKAAALKAAEEAKAKTAIAEAEIASAKKAVADEKIAEAKILELRKIDFDTAARDLAEWKADLEERERALQPEKTIADLSWAGGEEDSVIDADGTLRKVPRKAYLAENDKSLTRGTRRLAKEERLVREAEDEAGRATRAKVVAALEALYEKALREDRVVDADFYRKSLKSLYPDWEFGKEGAANAPKDGKEEKKE